MTPEPIIIDGRSGTVVYLDADWHPVSPEQATMARVLFDDGGSAFYVAQEPKTQPEGLGGITRKFDAALHPRGEDGRFIEATQPRIFNRPEELAESKGWGGDPTRWVWKDPKTGESTGRLLTGEPIARKDLPETLYHVTTNAPAVESSGVLLGLLGDGGLGGGQAPGVSMTSSKEDAVVIQRELRRAVEIARGERNEKVFEFWARVDEEEAKLPKGSLQYAADQAMEGWEGNKFLLERTSVPGEGYTGPPPSPEEHERIRRSLMKDALNAYLWARETAAEKATGHKVESLKNPILFGRQEQLAKLNPKDVQILEIPSAQIPEGALVSTGSDKFLHEVRAYSDVPLLKKLHSIAKFDPNQPRDPAGVPTGGQFAKDIASDPVLAEQATAGIAAIEKLMPEALRTTHFEGLTEGWSDLKVAAQKKVQEKYGVGQYPASWEDIDDAQKYALAIDMRMRGELSGDIVAYPRERLFPQQWVTGVQKGDKNDDNYARTHAIAQRLTELRMDELRKERGLLGQPTETPKYSYTIVDQSVEKGPLKKLNFVIYDETGNAIGASNTMEQAKINAEAWLKGTHGNPPQSPISSQEVIQDVWEAWKHKSSEGLGLSLQLAAARELGGVHRMTPEEVKDAEDYASYHGGMATLQAYVRAQWEVTQTIMKKAGEDKLDVYRAIMLPEEKVKAETTAVVDKLGEPIAPPKNIKILEEHVEAGQPTPDGWSQAGKKTYVTFDYMGNHFTVEKEVAMKRPKYKSILDIPKDPDEGYVATIETNEEAIQRRVNEYHQSVAGQNVFTKLPDIKLQRAGAQSTTGTQAVANSWQGVGNLPDNPVRVVLRIEAPPTSVLSLPVYGKNIIGEHESVLMGTKDKWLWDAWRERAPDFESHSISGKPKSPKPLVMDWGKAIDYDSQMAMAHKAESQPLVVDLQAEDRGKPHWLSGLQSVAKKEFNPALHPRQPGGTAEGGEFAASAPILQGVDFKANAKREIKRFLDQSEKRLGSRESAADLKEVETELRTLPLIHGTTVEGAVAAATEGLHSFAELQKHNKELVAETDDLRKEIEKMVPAKERGVDWSEFTYDDIRHLGLSMSDAQEMNTKIHELLDLEKTLEGTTFEGDKKLGLDRFVFMTHGTKHSDYGTVGVVIDNKLVKDSWATEKDIMTVPGAQVGNIVGRWEQYNPDVVEAYRKSIVKGEDYYKVAAAQGAFLHNRSKHELFELKTPSVPKSAVLGFITNDLDDAQLLADKLAAKGSKLKVLYTGSEDPVRVKEVTGDHAYPQAVEPFGYHQLKTIQETGLWDEDLVEKRREAQGSAARIL